MLDIGSSPSHHSLEYIMTTVVVLFMYVAFLTICRVILVDKGVLSHFNRQKKREKSHFVAIALTLNLTVTLNHSATR